MFGLLGLQSLMLHGTGILEPDPLLSAPGNSRPKGVLELSSSSLLVQEDTTRFQQTQG
jgi:hypothetical protein